VDVSLIATAPWRLQSESQGEAFRLFSRAFDVLQNLLGPGVALRCRAPLTRRHDASLVTAPQRTRRWLRR
jgi:hypothetical protein